MTYSEPVRNQKPNRLGTGNRTEPNRFLNYIPRNRTEPNREPEIHQFLETEPNRTEPIPPCICMFTGSSTLNIDPYQTFIWCFFCFFRKEPWTIAVNWEHHFHFLYWMTHLRYTTGIPFSHDHGMTYVKDISQIQDHFRDGIDGMCQTTKKYLVSGFHPVSPSRKIFGWTSELWRFPRSWGYHGGIQIIWLYKPSAIGVPPWLWKPQSIWNHFSQNVAVGTRNWAQSSQSKKTLRMADK